MTFYRIGLAKELSEQEDFKVDNVVTHPEEIFHLLSEKTPDAILMDIRMGMYNGMKLTDEIKNLYPEIKIVLMSGYNMGQLAKSSRADAFASKEEPIELLSSTIRKVCLEEVEVFPAGSPFEENLTETEIQWNTVFDYAVFPFCTVSGSQQRSVYFVIFDCGTFMYRNDSEKI